MNESIPMLITSSIIVSDPYKKVTDLDLRISSTVEAIGKWLTHSPGIQIVVCDGSGFDLTPILSEKFPNESIECLAFNNSQEIVKTKGGGYGEGEIIEYALTHSKILLRSKAFAKCTSKLWVKNYDECLRSWNQTFICNGHFDIGITKPSNLISKILMRMKISLCFLKPKNQNRLYNQFVIDHLGPRNIKLEAIDTRFYITDREFYKTHFAKCHEMVNHQSQYFLEYVFKDIALRNQLQHFIFPSTPIIEGLSGSTGEIYQEIQLLDWKIEEAIKREILKSKTSFISQ